MEYHHKKGNYSVHIITKSHYFTPLPIVLFFKDSCAKGIDIRFWFTLITIAKEHFELT